MTFEERHEGYIARVEDALEQNCARLFQPGSRISEAARYSLMNGGKRVRGVLVLATSEMLGDTSASAGNYATAIEMVHAFSLVHDDLPCMDDDDLRRGKPACHIQYGEATALLAGDLLSLEAFSAIACAPGSAHSRIAATELLAAGAGAKGMIYGQELDLAAEGKAITIDELKEIHSRKTGCLFRASVLLGVLAAEEDPLHHPAIRKYAENLGLVFQIIDDILDVTADEGTLGKPVGSDSAQGKNTYATLLGLEEAKREAEQLTGAACGALRAAYGERAEFLCEYAGALLRRIK